MMEYTFITRQIDPASKEYASGYEWETEITFSWNGSEYALREPHHALQEAPSRVDFLLKQATRMMGHS